MTSEYTSEEESGECEPRLSLELENASESIDRPLNKGLDCGARNAIETCLNVKPAEKVIIIGGSDEKDIVDALEKASKRITKKCSMLYS